MPMPGRTDFPLVVLPRGACGTTIWAAWDGLCIGWIDAGESFGVEVEDMVRACDKARCKVNWNARHHVAVVGHVTVVHSLTPLGNWL